MEDIIYAQAHKHIEMEMGRIWGQELGEEPGCHGQTELSTDKCSGCQVYLSIQTPANVCGMDGYRNMKASILQVPRYHPHTWLNGSQGLHSELFHEEAGVQKLVLEYQSEAAHLLGWK